MTASVIQQSLSMRRICRQEDDCFRHGYAGGEEWQCGVVCAFRCLAASKALPFSKDVFEETIKSGGKGIEASLRAFNAAHERATKARMTSFPPRPSRSWKSCPLPPDIPRWINSLVAFARSFRQTRIHALCRCEEADGVSGSGLRQRVPDKGASLHKADAAKVAQTRIMLSRRRRNIWLSPWPMMTSSVSRI